MKGRKKSGLWTKDFSIITVGSMVSMFGNQMAIFAVSLFALDYSNNTFLYGTMVFLYTLPQILMPFVAGPLLDWFSRRRTIYMLDFLSAVLFVVLALSIWMGWFSMPFLLAVVFVIGAINSFYMVAFNSFYPMLIPEGNYEKAYSVSSTIDMVSYTMVPLATALYKLFGILPILLLNAGSFVIAAIFETRISDVESALEIHEKPSYSLRKYIEDSKEGFRYTFREKGLFLITLYFMLNAVAGGASYVVTLPWFRNTYVNGEVAYMTVWGFMIAGRIVAAFINYKWRIKKEWKYRISVICLIAASLFEAFYLLTGLWIMRLSCFFIGLSLGIAYNIRTSTTQAYVPNDMKGRYNGVYLISNTTGLLIGQITGGAVAIAVSTEKTLMIYLLSLVVAAVVILIGGRKHVKQVFNRET